MIKYIMTLYEKQPQQKPWVKLQLRCIVSNYSDQSQTISWFPLYTPGLKQSSAVGGTLLRCFSAELLFFSCVDVGPVQLFWVFL